MTAYVSKCIALIVLTLTLTSCARGIFTWFSCDSTQRVAVPASARSAIYFDSTGAPLGTRAEDLTGTANNRMCPQ